VRCAVAERACLPLARTPPAFGSSGLDIGGWDSVTPSAGARYSGAAGVYWGRNEL